ncbi:MULTISPECIES: DUF3800 domain-containing protein [unclassified Aminobacter]|uniref:DUF3800 domain-containing protein n=1 Tax=unclassified Aminobacter TaxID=2644704 RepID=UPI000465CBC0|nr:MULTISPECIES: DUF3800 domain-containing protein [unclassified Aminobacter]TWG55065.1 uncharacterized protein DUF3800 [Aminobacter sp. J44]TWH30077.1 uncharacterized protein DUF3800 [Aminobacter sp. J15]
MQFSDYIVFADESGDHGMLSIDPEYPIFVLTFCVIAKASYIEQVIPAVQQFKFDFWGHDAVILHEHDIRKSRGDFAFLRTDRDIRARFYDRLNTLMADVPFDLFAAVIDKEMHRRRYANPWNPYEIALRFCMEQLHGLLERKDEQGKTVHVVFESRGRVEDDSLELEFLRIAGNQGQWGYRRTDFGNFSFAPIFIPKSSNSVGLQLADLTARPIGLRCLRREQPNRAFDIIHSKIRGLKTFP